MVSKATYSVMLSSTYRELAEHRQAVRDAMLGQHMFPIAMENDSAIPDQDLIDASLAKVDEADAYAGLISYRYGQIPKCPNRNPDQLSLTELEFRRAIARDIPICMFIMHQEHLVPMGAVTEEHGTKQKLESFLRLAKKDRIYAEFKSVDDLKAKTVQSLVRLREVLDKRAASGLSSTRDAPSLPPITDPDAGIRCIDEHEPKPVIFGRDDEVETIVGALLAGKTALVAGGPGMGKTAVATAALYDPRVVARFGRRRVFASLEAATEPRAILAKLVETLGLAPTGDEATLLRIIEANVAERPVAAILDNAETVFDADRAEAERLLNLVAGINGLSLAVTIRGVPPPVSGAIPIDNLSKLAAGPARDAFLAVAGSSFGGDPDLPHLLEALDGHALSIRLVAAQAIGSPSLKGLRESWDDAHAEILRIWGEEEGRLTSVRASLALSLNSRRMKSTPLARRLMALLAFLPGGLAETDVRLLLGERGALTKARANEAVVCLRQLRLVEQRPDRRLRMLTPLRECVKSDVLPLEIDRNRIIERYLALAAKAYTIGSRDWEKSCEEVEAEADNLDTVCELAIATNITNKYLEEALVGLKEFHIFSGRGAIGSLERAVTRLRPKPPSQLAASCIQSLGEIARARSDHDSARARFKEALALYRRIDGVVGEANCIQCLGEIAHACSEYETARACFEEAMAIFRRVGGVLGEANCIKNLGNIAHARSDHETARARFEEALALYRRIGGVLGEANCIQSLGDIAHARSEYETARARSEEALALYRRIGGVLGEANCIQSLGDIAHARSEYETARARCEEALALYRRIGNVPGEANCIRSLGAIALARSDHETARLRFEEALALCRRISNVPGEANCIQSLGDIALARSDHETARARFEEALALYRRISAVGGEANCIQSFGYIANARSDHETARARFEEALALYRRIGDVLGEANCIKRLGDIADARSDHQTARARYEEALALYRCIGDVSGEANCIRSFGDIARARSDHETARARFEEALALYRRIGDVLGEAETLIRRGQTRRKDGDAVQGLADIEAGFAFYFSVAEAEDRALAGWQAMHRALTCGDTNEAEKYRGQARSAWTAIGRLDLVHDWLDQAP